MPLGKALSNSKTRPPLSGQWQDGYHVPTSAGILYVKFPAEILTDFHLLSFKET